MDELRNGRVLLNTHFFNECSGDDELEQHEKENLAFTSDDGFLVKLEEDLGYDPRIDEIERTIYHIQEDKKETERYSSQKDEQGTEISFLYDTLCSATEHSDVYLSLRNPVDILIDREGNLCIQHEYGDVLQEMRIICNDKWLNAYMFKKADDAERQRTVDLAIGFSEQYEFSELADSISDYPSPEDAVKDMNASLLTLEGRREALEHYRSFGDDDPSFYEDKNYKNLIHGLENLVDIKARDIQRRRPRRRCR